jgi:hypothetical protein
MHPTIASAIEKYGAILQLGPDLDRPYTVAYTARLVYRQGAPAVATGRTAAEALAALIALLTESTQ